MFIVGGCGAVPGPAQIQRIPAPVGRDDVIVMVGIAQVDAGVVVEENLFGPCPLNAPQFSRQGYSTTITPRPAVSALLAQAIMIMGGCS